jgi:hypothetical protein
MMKLMPTMRNSLSSMSSKLDISKKRRELRRLSSKEIE